MTTRSAVSQCQAAVGAVILLSLATAPVWAIPSPDLLINFLASAAQLLGILSVMVGSAWRTHATVRGMPAFFSSMVWCLWIGWCPGRQLDDGRKARK